MTKNIYLYIKILAVIGVGLAIYLLVEQITQTSFRPCSINATINCDAIIDGPVAKTLAIPTPLYGLVGYIVIFLAAIWKKGKLMLAMTTFGLLFCLYIGFVELVLLKVICPVCLACQAIMIIVFTLSIIVYKKFKTPAL